MFERFLFPNIVGVDISIFCNDDDGDDISTETSLNFCEPTRRHIPEDIILHSQRRQMFKSRTCSPDIIPENKILEHICF